VANTTEPSAMPLSVKLLSVSSGP